MTAPAAGAAKKTVGATRRPKKIVGAAQPAASPYERGRVKETDRQRKAAERVEEQRGAADVRRETGTEPAQPPGAPIRLPALPGSVSGPVETGAGFVLGLIFWGWVAMPFLTGGAAGVRKVLKAKFLNKAPDGSWLP